MYLYVPNEEDLAHEKIVYIQVTYTGSEPLVDVMAGSGESFPGTGSSFPSGMGDPLWSVFVYETTIRYCPALEVIKISWPDANSPHTYVDEAVVDTICTPEPATLAGLLALGAGVTIRRRRSIE